MKFNEGYGDEWVWTSGMKDDDDSVQWVGINQKATYTNWASGEPNNRFYQQERCISLFGTDAGSSAFKWNDLSCDWELYFVCERAQE